jgi:hypothetical protein
VATGATSYPDSEHEIRNPKQYRMSKIQIIQTIGAYDIVMIDLFLSLEHLIFEFVSSFEIRISNFAEVKTANHALWA